MPEDPKDDRLRVQKEIAAKVLRAAARMIREAKDPNVAEAAMRVVGKELQNLPGALNRLMSAEGQGGKAAPEIQPPELAEFLRRRRTGHRP